MNCSKRGHASGSSSRSGCLDFAVMRDRLKLVLPVPDSYLSAIGHVITQWAYFEMQFDDCLGGFLLHHPDARALAPHIPDPFKKRAKLWKDAARKCFSNTPRLEARFIAIAEDALRLRAERDHLAHGGWHLAGENIGAYLRHRTGRYAVKLIA